jgi:hypothetical protein
VPLPSHPHTRIAFYADNTTLYPSSKSPTLLCKHLQCYLDALALWCRVWKVTINVMKSKAILISRNASLCVCPSPLMREDSMVFSTEILGSHYRQVFWQLHVDYVVPKVKVATTTLYPLLRIKSKLSL